MKTDHYIGPIYAVTSHKHTHPWTQCEESKRQPPVGHVFSAAHAKYVKKTIIHVYIYIEKDLYMRPIYAVS